MTLLEVRGLSKRYGNATVLDGVDFDLREGEILGVIGPNGAGKTTLMECLVGLSACDGGSVNVEGRTVAPQRRRHAMFYLPDGVVPWSDQPVWRITGLFREVHGLRRDQEAVVTERLELRPVLAKRAGELSKGYRRRLLLAVALLTPQPILVLDEPFDGFDLRQTLHVMALLREVATERALLLSIHQLRDAERICDRLLLLNAGRRIGLGTLSELAAQAGTNAGNLEDVFLGLTQ